MNAGATCRKLTSGKNQPKECSEKKLGPYHQANSGTDQEGTIQNIDRIPLNVK